MDIYNGQFTVPLLSIFVGVHTALGLGEKLSKISEGGVVRSNPLVEPNKTVSLQYYTVCIKNEQLSTQ